jgi:hypothetical protein
MAASAPGLIIERGPVWRALRNDTRPLSQASQSPMTLAIKARRYSMAQDITPEFRRGFANLSTCRILATARLILRPMATGFTIRELRGW